MAQAMIGSCGSAKQGEWWREREREKEKREKETERERDEKEYGESSDFHTCTAKWFKSSAVNYACHDLHEAPDISRCRPGRHAALPVTDSRDHARERDEQLEQTNFDGSAP